MSLRLEEGILNHEELISTFAKALAEIADVLPRTEIKLKLYSTNTMQDAVTNLFACVIQFVQRAVKWFTAGRLKHAYHAIIHPASLTYSDLLETISRHGQLIDKLATDAAQTEQRDIHNMLIEVKQLILNHQSLNSSKYLDFTRYLQQIQHIQILELTAKSVLPSPHNSLQHYRVMAARRRARSESFLNEIRKSRALQEWGSATESTILFVKGSFRTSHQARDLAVDVISLIKSSNVPVVWVLNNKQDGIAFQPFMADLLKLLAHQIMQINPTLHNTQSSIMKFQAAQTESDWLEILASLLHGLEQIYIILDVEVLGDDICEMAEWTSIFSELFARLRHDSIPTIVKVALLSYRKDSTESTDPCPGYLLDLSRMKHLAVQKGQSSPYHSRRVRRGRGGRRSPPTESHFRRLG